METLYGRRGLRLIVLSNFAGKTAEAMRHQREREYEREVVAHRMRLEVACRIRAEAWSKAKCCLSRLDLMRAWQSWRKSRLADKEIARIKAQTPVLRSASIEEDQARAGDEAERRLDGFLSEALGDQWTLIAGYHGKTGEIDRILIGPWGIYAFEIKGNRGVIHSDGTRWWVERFDRCGNPLETKTLPRAPDAQLAKTVGWLEEWLRRNGVDLRVGKVVLFTAEDARIGMVRAANVDMVTTLMELDLGDLLLAPGSKSSALAPITCEHVVKVITRDHSFWEQKRSGRSIIVDILPGQGRRFLRQPFQL